MLSRTVSHETLDALAPDDPRALRSRRDLQRVNRVMGSGAILLRALRPLGVPAGAPARLRILEIGAGDGSLMLAIAARLAPAWPDVELTLLDRLPLVEPRTIEAFARLGWAAASLAIDVLDWAVPASVALPSPPGSGYWDLIVANLFLHHFEGPVLALLLGAIAARCDAFCACEPRRGWLPLAAQPPGRRARCEPGDARRRGAQRARRLPRRRDRHALARHPGDLATRASIRPGSSATASAPGGAAAR